MTRKPDLLAHSQSAGHFVAEETPAVVSTELVFVAVCETGAAAPAGSAECPLSGMDGRTTVAAAAVLVPVPVPAADLAADIAEVAAVVPGRYTASAVVVDMADMRTAAVGEGGIEDLQSASEEEIVTGKLVYLTPGRLLIHIGGWRGR